MLGGGSSLGGVVRLGKLGVQQAGIENDEDISGLDRVAFIGAAASGEQRSGFNFALWAIAQKAALAIAVGIAFPLLGWSGFDPAIGQKTESGLTMLAFLARGV